MKIKTILAAGVMAFVLTSCLGTANYESKFNSVSSFEYAGFAEAYPDSIYNATYSIGGDAVAYNVGVDDAKNFQGGFTVSMLCDPVIADGHEPRSVYCVADTSGANKSAAFAVFYQNPDPSKMNFQDMIFTLSSSGTIAPVKMFVNNTNLVVNTIRYGKDGVEPFKEGDYLKVTLTPYAGDDASGYIPGSTSVTVTLAEYAAIGLSVITNWKEVDLSKMGGFNYIDVEMTSNRTDIPMYFCMDNFEASVVVGTNVDK